MRELIGSGLRAATVAAAVAVGTLAASACGVDDGYPTAVVSTGGGGGSGGQTGNFSITILSGNNQTAQVGRNVNDSLAVTVTQGGVAAPGVSVAWTVVSGSAVVAATSSTTNDQGVAKTLVAIGSIAERSTVRAAVSGASVDFSVAGQLPPP